MQEIGLNYCKCGNPGRGAQGGGYVRQSVSFVLASRIRAFGIECNMRELLRYFGGPDPVREKNLTLPTFSELG